MSRRKQAHFAEMKTMPHVLEFPEDTAGNWNDHFGNENDIVLEVACGRGEYTLGMASLMPNKNFVGIDIKGSRIWHGAKQVENQQLKNASFLRTRIELLDVYFDAAEVDEIWITFPDPHPREGKAQKRLTSLRFLDVYTSILKPGGQLYLKTDNQDLFTFSLETLEEDPRFALVSSSRDLYAEGHSNTLLTNIKTRYELKFLTEGKTICYLLASKRN